MLDTVAALPVWQGDPRALRERDGAVQRHLLGQPAAVVGSTLWAVLYATVGLAVLQASLAAETGSWWGAAVVVVVVAGAVVWVVSHRRRAHLRAQPVPGRVNAPFPPSQRPVP